MKTILLLLCAGAIFYVSTKIILSRIKIGRKIKMHEKNEFTLKNPSFVPWAGNKYFIVGIVAIWLCSLALPGIVDSSPVPGIYILVVGILGPLQAVFSWYANPCALFAIRYLLRHKYKEALNTSFIAILLGLQALIIPADSLNISGSDVDNYFTLGIGYYVWMLALVLLFILCLFNFTRTKNIQN